MLILLMVNVLCVFYAMSGIAEIPRKLIWKWLYPGIKFKEDFLIQPLQCSWCLGTWFGLLALCWIGWTPLNVVLVLVMAYMNSLLEDVLRLVKDLIATVINWLYDHLVR